ncbi:glycosyltransferase [Amylibacter marinus]|nr:hypothetical protein [Amylibacter marinus]
MKHQDLEKQRQPAVNGVKSLPQTPQSVLFYGCLFEQGRAQTAEAVQFNARLIETGWDLHTVSGRTDTLNQKIVNYRTPYKFKRSVAFLAKYDRVIIQLAEFAHPSYQCGTIWRKTKERVRMHRMLNLLIQSGHRVHLVGTRRQMFQSGLVHLPKHASFDTLPALLCALGGVEPPLKSKSIQRATRVLYDHANYLHQDGRFTATRLHSQLQHQAHPDDDLVKICEFAQSSAFFRHGLVTRVRRARIQPSAPAVQTTPPHPLRDIAMHNAEESGLPRYALHLRAFFGLTTTYPIATHQQKEAFLRWYVEKSRERLPDFWVPRPTDDRPNLDTDASKDALDIAHYLEDPNHAKLCNPEIRALLQKRVCETGPTGLAILLALLVRLPVSQEVLDNPWQAGEIAHWFSKVVLNIEPELGPRNAPLLSQSTGRCIAQISGLSNGGSGLAVNFEMTRQALDKLSIPATLLDVENRAPPQQHTSHSAQTKVRKNFIIHHVNADRVPLACMTPQLCHRNDIFHIGYFLWETSALPEIHQLGIDLMNEIWTPSTFVTDLYRANSNQVVKTMGKSIPQLSDLANMADKATRDPNSFTVVNAFDFHSSLERKNPLATLIGFQRAFPKKQYPHARLILKSTPSASGHWGDPNDQLAQIRKAQIQDSRIKLIEERIPTLQFFQLIAQADCVVSSHRGEGFGYLPAYALALKRPLICTNWGGNTDFCTKRTSLLLEPNLIPVPQGHSIYEAKGAQWANVDPNQIATHLHSVLDDPLQAKKRAQKGFDEVWARYAPETYANSISQRLQDLGLI